MKNLKECKVLVTPTSYASQDPALKTDLEKLVGGVVYNTTGKPLSSGQLQELLPDMDGMIAGLDEIDAAAIGAAPNLKVIARYGAGYNNVDLDAARQRGIVVTNTPGANASAVAELTVALILDMLRPVIQANDGLKKGEWPRYKGVSLVGKTVGLIGLGAIGKETAKRLSGFGCTVLAYDTFPDEKFAVNFDVKLTLLDELLATADIISLHLPGTIETEGFVDSGFLGKMKKGAWLVNTARGNLIDEQALIKALQSGQLRGAALDVYSQEPPDPKSQLLQMEGVITTPHMGAHTDSATNAMGRMALEECLAVLKGEEPSYEVL